MTGRTMGMTQPLHTIHTLTRPSMMRGIMAVAMTLVVAGCTTSGGESSAVESTLDINTPEGTTAVDPNAEGTQTASLQAFAGSTARVHFAPIVGAPVEQVNALSQRLSTAGPQNAIRLEPAAGRGINHEIRGYFSALSENGQTTVIHVWDVFTPNGQRVHRIQGQERASGTAANPWDAVTASMMQTIADKVLADYNAWRGQNT